PYAFGFQTAGQGDRADVHLACRENVIFHRADILDLELPDEDRLRLSTRIRLCRRQVADTGHAEAQLQTRRLCRGVDGVTHEVVIRAHVLSWRRPGGVG